jgi:hypothetical protein
MHSSVNYGLKVVLLIINKFYLISFEKKMNFKNISSFFKRIYMNISNDNINSLFSHKGNEFSKQIAQTEVNDINESDLFDEYNYFN